MSVKSASVAAVSLSCVLTLTPAPACAAEPPGSPRSPEQLARELMSVTGGGDVGKQMAAQIVESLRGRHGEVPDDFWTEFLAGIDARQLEELVVPIYVRHLTVEEMTAAIDFFGSPIGQAYVRKQVPMLQESMAAGQEWGKQLAQRAMARLAEHPAAIKANADREAQRQTVKDLRNVGTAMMAWLTDNHDGGGAASPCSGELSIFGSACPLATPDQVVAALVPKYLAEVPEKDGWGNPYQFLFARELFSVGMRSPGRDGKYEADEYSSSKVPPADYDRDLVWRNGFFVRWPQS